MKDAVIMWREPRMVVLTALCAAVYAAAMIPFKFLVVFPGLAEVRPAAVFPVVFSLLFGPAGAWGAGFGNLVGDMLGGMFGPGSLFGFLANFAYGYVPYKIWEVVGGGREVSEISSWGESIPGWMKRKGPALGALLGLFAACVAAIFGLAKLGVLDVGALVSARSGGEEQGLGLLPGTAVLAAGAALVIASAVLLAYSPLRLMVAVAAGCAACAGILGWGVDLLGFFPFRVFATWVLANNIGVCVMLAPPLLLLLYPRVASMYMRYTDLLPKRSPPGKRGYAGALVVFASLVLIFAAGYWGPGLLESAFGVSEVGSGLAVSPFAALFFGGLFLLED